MDCDKNIGAKFNGNLLKLFHESDWRVATGVKKIYAFVKYFFASIYTAGR